MLDFNLEISRNGSDFYSIDLFPDQRLDYSLDFYDNLEIDKIKMPFNTTLRIPLTANNQGVNRFGFNPTYSTGGDFPRDDFHFNLYIYGSVKTQISGVLNVVAIEYNSDEPYVEVELKDQLAYYLTQIKEVNLAELYDLPKYTNQETLATFTTEFQDIGAGGQEGRLGVEPDEDEAIIFPYVDMNNDLEKYGYPQRQFLEYGTGDGRNGLIPAFSVKKFLEYLGDYLSTVDFPVRVDSNLFAVGDFDGNPYDADMQPEKLRFINSAHMRAKYDVNQRNFTLRQNFAWVGHNVSLEYIEGLNGLNKHFKTRYWGNMEIHGNGGDWGGQTDWSQQTWGVRKRMSPYPDSTTDYQRGWFCPKVSYNAQIRLEGNPYGVTISGLEFEIPVLGEDEMVVDLDVAGTTMTFTPYVAIYEDGLMIKKIALEDINGDRLELSPTGKKEAYSNKNDNSGDAHYLDEDDDITLAVDNTGITLYDTFTFDSFTAYLANNEHEFFVNGGSRYSINYFLEPNDGDLQAKKVASWAKSGGVKYGTAFSPSFLTYSSDKIRKAVTRIPTTTQNQKLNLSIQANKDPLPHNATDIIVIKDSIENTTEDTIYDVLLRIAKRFNCGLYYEYDAVEAENVLRIDPLHVMRGGTQNVDELVDDAKSVKISSGGSRVKTLELNNKSYDRYFDESANGVVMGSTTQVINNEGTDDVKIDLDSSVYYKSLCSVESFERPANLVSGAFSENQLGLGRNIYSRNDEVGFRFAYVKAPQYNTWILHPFITYTSDTQFTGSMKTETERLYLADDIGKGELSGVRMTYNGELTHVNALGFDLRAEDEDGVVTDYYNLYSAGESLRLANNALIEFDMIVHTSDLSKLDFFMQVLTAPSITPNDIYVKSATGDVFGDYAYLTIEGLMI